jgi:hypothetical protein
MPNIEHQAAQNLRRFSLICQTASLLKCHPWVQRKRNVFNHRSFETKAGLNSIQELSPYHKENTLLHSYKDESINAV